MTDQVEKAIEILNAIKYCYASYMHIGVFELIPRWYDNNIIPYELF